MKKALLISSVAIALLASCKKENVNKPAPSATNTIPAESVSIEYVIHASSGNFTFEYTAPNTDGKPVTYTGNANKMQQTFSFTWEKYQTLKVKAMNTNPSADEVTVEIYANGNLIKAGSANAPGAWAIAEGVAK